MLCWYSFYRSESSRSGHTYNTTVETVDANGIIPKRQTRYVLNQLGGRG